MRFGVKTKEAVAVTALTFLVVATTTVVHLSQLSRVVVAESLEQAELIGKQVYAQSRRAIARSPGTPAVRVLRADPELHSLLEASVGYSPQLLYVVVASRTGLVILGSGGEKPGRILPERPRLSELLSLDPWQRFLALYRGQQTYEAALPMELNGQPFGSIRLGVSTTLVRPELEAALKQSLTLAGVALPVAWLVAMGLAGVILKPIRTLALEVGKLRNEEAGAGGEAGGGDEVGELAAQIQHLGHQIHSDRLAMLSERDRLQQVVDHLEDGVLFLNQGGEILFYNRAAGAIVGRPLEETVGLSVNSALASTNPLRAVLERSLTRQDEVRNATIVVPGGGKSREFLVSHFFVSDARRTMGSMVFLRDLSSLKTLQSLISYSTKLAALGRITSGMAHEVKNPLNAMMIHAEILKEELAGSPGEVQASLEVIRGEIRRLDRAVQGFLNFMRPQELSLKPVDLNALLREIAVLLEREWHNAGVRIMLDLDPSVPPVTADEELLRQMFLNIVLNACQSMPSGGPVRIFTQGDKEDGAGVTVKVADEGVGIAPEDREKVFKLYYTTKTGGSGIGLSLAYRIVQMHDGDIEVDSEMGRGTTMVVRLPGNGGRI